MHELGQTGFEFLYKIRPKNQLFNGKLSYYKNNSLKLFVFILKRKYHYFNDLFLNKLYLEVKNNVHNTRLIFDIMQIKFLNKFFTQYFAFYIYSLYLKYIILN